MLLNEKEAKMLLNLTDLSNEPLQSQITRQIRAKILSGEIESGHELPSIRTLAREQHISVITVQRAYEILEREGLIFSRRGKGFFTREIKDDRKKEIAKQRLLEKIEPILNTAMDEGMETNEILNSIGSLLKKKGKDNHDI
jgi:GntR family transcriptional regulator